MPGMPNWVATPIVLALEYLFGLRGFTVLQFSDSLYKCVCMRGTVCALLQDQYLQEGVEWEAVEVGCNHSLLQTLQEVSQLEPCGALW